MALTENIPPPTDPPGAFGVESTWAAVSFAFTGVAQGSGTGTAQVSLDCDGEFTPGAGGPLPGDPPNLTTSAAFGQDTMCSGFDGFHSLSIPIMLGIPLSFSMNAGAAGGIGQDGPWVFEGGPAMTLTVVNSQGDPVILSGVPEPRYWVIVLGFSALVGWKAHRRRAAGQSDTGTR